MTPTDEHAKVDRVERRLRLVCLCLAPLLARAKGDPGRVSMNTVLTSYKHYKGGTYTLLMVGRNSEERGQELAVYVSHATQQVWVRPLIMFNEPVIWPDGVTRSRFVSWDGA